MMLVVHCEVDPVGWTGGLLSRRLQGGEKPRMTPWESERRIEIEGNGQAGNEAHGTEDGLKLA